MSNINFFVEKFLLKLYKDSYFSSSDLDLHFWKNETCNQFFYKVKSLYK